MENCPCLSSKTYCKCCEPLHQGLDVAKTAEQLMRSRYSAFAKVEIDYLLATTHPSTRKNHRKNDLKSWATKNNWQRLEILFTSENQVAFKAYFQSIGREVEIHYEKSTFIFEEGRWFYLDGEFE
jgi:SEC-C motif domain protein